MMKEAPNKSAEPDSAHYVSHARKNACNATKTTLRVLLSYYTIWSSIYRAGILKANEGDSFGSKEQQLV